MDFKKYPRPNWPYLIIVALIGTLGLAICIWGLTSPLYYEWSHSHVITGELIWWKAAAYDLAFALPAFYWKIYRDANTVIKSNGITQPSIRGARTIAWSEITRVRSLGSLGYHIYAGRKKITVTAYAYKNAPEVVETLRGQFKDHNIQL
jgi:hypothetical protein